jgi:FtsZ-binding cell division protein ZapB
MMEIEELLQKREELQKSVSQAQEAAAVARANRDRLKKELQEQLQVLKEDFGCQSFSDAQVKLEEMRAEAESLCDQIEEGLRALGS